MADNQNTDASVSTFVSSVIFTSVVSIALFSAFAILRPRFPRVYSPKTYIGSEHERLDGSFGGIRKSVFSTRKLNDNEFIERCGLDAYMFIEFLKKSFFLFLVFTFLAVPILVPLDACQQLGLGGLNQFTIANISDQKRLWAHLVLTVMFCGVKRIWLAYTTTDLQKDIVKRTAIARKLEAAESTLIGSKLEHHLKNGRRASHASTNPLSSDDTSHLEHHNTAISDESFPPELRPHHRPASFPASLFARCCGVEKVDSIQTYRTELTNINASILTRQQAAMTAMLEGQDNGKITAAFIQFNYQLGAHLAVQSVIHRHTLTMGPRRLEVHPKDVLWDNLNLNLKSRNIRKTIAILLAATLIIFWTIPVAFVASIAQLDTIVEFAPFLSGVYDLPNAVVGIIQGVLPAIGLAVLMMLLPIILYKLAHLGGEVLHTQKTLAVVTSYHWFSVVQVLLVTTLANGIFASVQAIKDNPNNIMIMLSSSLPQASTFFLTFILISMIQIPMLLLQIGPLIGYLIGKWLSSTPRQMYATETTLGSVDWGTTIPPFDFDGLILPRIIDQIYIAVILFEIVMLGLFILQKAVGQSIVAFILVVASLFTIVITRNSVFKSLIRYLPVEAFEAQTAHAAMSGNAMEMASAPETALANAGTGDIARKPDLEKASSTINSGRVTEKCEGEKSTSTSPMAELEYIEPISFNPTDSPRQGATPLESQLLRNESAVSHRSQLATGSPLPSIRLEKTGSGVPRSTREGTSKLPPHRGHLSLRGSEHDYPGTGSSLQVLGANHSILSSSDPAAESVVPETLTYLNPALWKQVQPIWLPKDPRGFAELETVEMIDAGLPCTTIAAIMDMKGHISVEVSGRETAPGEEIWE
ncbi:hypothetical protein BGX26_011468 [Mortierella sp. AD094]|nr:hypothetical protein BGX26_011468 [Mortierella sp. AD094]